MTIEKSGVPWARGRKDEFERYMHHQLFNVLGDHEKLCTEWKRRIEQWRSRLPDEIKEYPWLGASNLVFPLTSIHGDPIYADFMQTFHASGKDFWHVHPIHGPNKNAVANALRETLSIVDRDFLRLRDVNAKQFLYNIILGTGIYKTHYLHNQRIIKDRDRATGEAKDVVVIEDGPKIEYIPLNHFVIPADAWDIDPDAPVGGAVWVAQKCYKTKSQLRAHAENTANPFLPAYDRKVVDELIAMRAEANDTLDDKVDAAIRTLDDYVPWESRKFELFEIWVRFDIDNDGIDEDLVVVWSQDLRKILRITFNPFDHGKRPFERIRYLEGFGFYGIGLAEIDEWAQETLSKLLNYQIDNVFLANTRMLNVPRGTNISADEPMYPGKTWITEPGEEVKSVQMGDIYQSLPQLIGFMLNISESSSGASDLRQGNVQNLPSRTPAATTLSMLAESNKRFGEIMSSMREPYSRMGLQVFQLIAQHYQQDPTRWTTYLVSNLGEEDAQLVTEVLSQRVDRIGEGFGIQPVATSAAANKEADKQNFIAVVQLVSQIYPQLIQTISFLDQIPEGSPARDTVLSAYVGGVELLKLLLERFDIQNADEYVPNIRLIQEQQNANDAQIAQQAGPGQGGQGIDPAEVSPLGGFFGPGPFAGAQRQLGTILGL